MGWFGRSDKDYQEEIREHIEMEVQANINRGMSPDEARRTAHVTFGGVTKARQHLYEGRSDYWIDTLRQDIRYGCRMIRRNARISCLVVTILSLGIGLTAGVFSLVSASAFAPPVARDPDSFVQFFADVSQWTSAETSPAVATGPRYEYLRQHSQSMRELVAWSEIPIVGTLGSSDDTRFQSKLVSCNFFSVFGDKPPLHGRFLQSADCEPGQPVMVISEKLWRNRFGEDPEIIGRSVVYADLPMTIIGVVSPPEILESTDIFAPYSLVPLHKAVPAQVEKRIPRVGSERNQNRDSAQLNLMTSTTVYWLGMAGRLRPGYSRESATAEFRVLQTHGIDREFYWRLVLTDGSLWSAAPRETLWLFSAALALPTIALLIVCVTVATLLLSRSVGRRREMAVRLSLGGAKSRVVRMLLIENLLLAAMSAAISLVFVYGAPSILSRFVAPLGVRTPSVVQPDWRVFAYLGVLTLFTAVCSGVSPALESLNLQLSESLKGRAGLAGYRGPSRLRNCLIGFQVALCMIPLVGAAALIRMDRRVADPGVQTHRIVVAEIPLKVNEGETQTSLARAIEGLPSVRSVAYADSTPLVLEGGTLIWIGGRADQRVASGEVSAAYFATMGIPILAGRSFEESDHTLSDSSPVVVSQQFAERFFPGEYPVGKTVNQKHRIIGVAGATIGLKMPDIVNDGSFVYQLLEPSLKGYLIVRFDGNPETLMPALQTVLKQATGRSVKASTLRSRLGDVMAPFHRLQVLLAVLGVAVLGLALVGVFGIVSFTVAQRKKELAVRMALGANTREIFRNTFSVGLKPMPLGILAGILLSFAALRVAESSIFSIGRIAEDPVPYLVVSVLLLIASFAAMLSPAYRAASSNPAAALQEE